MPQAGWYDDQHDPRFLRWWDGVQWTHHLQQKPHVDVVREPADRREARSDQRSLTAAQREVQRLHAEMEQTRVRIAREEGKERDRLAADVRRLQGNVADAQTALGHLTAQIHAARQELVSIGAQAELQELGAYDFEHPGESSVDLKNEIAVTRSSYRSMATAGRATHVSQNFTFNNSLAKGRRFLTDLSKLALRSYNAEAENCVKTVRAGSLDAALARLDKAKAAAERLGRMFSLLIDHDYHALRRQEIVLAARHLQAIDRERELERARKEELREQARAQKELQAARAKLEREREHYLSVLSRLTEAGDDAGIARIHAQITDVNAALDDVDYRAANIRAGYVYVISNVGAFGPGVMKIGMTRRLDPMDRVRELGDASVPFRFDVHALFFANDAVGIEATLHRRFATQRINRVNLRREFFRVTPDEVLQALREEHVEVLEFNLDAQGEEYLASVTTAQATA